MDLYPSPFIVLVVRLLGIAILVGALGGLGFVLHQMTRASPDGEGDRNWRFLFSCWAESVAIMILYASLNFTWLYERFVGAMIAFTPLGSEPSPETSMYMVLALESVIYAVIMIVAVRLFLRIRRHLEAG